MFIHQFLYTFKILLRSRPLIFWTLAFPLIMATFFNMSFSNIENSEKLDIIPIAVVKDANFNKQTVFKSVLKELSDPKGDRHLFKIQYVSKTKAAKLLQDEKVDGYLQFTDQPQIHIHENGINATILKSTVDEIVQRQETIGRYIQKNSAITGDIEVIYRQAIDLMESNNYTITDTASSHLSYIMIEFYTLIAMTALYGGILGMTVINQMLPNMSAKGMRVSVSPTAKIRIIASGLLSAYVVQLIGVTLLFAYTAGLLHVDYGDRFGLIVLLTVIGCMAGSSLGVFLGSVIKRNENVKVGIIISITMVGSFLSGMMGITMKYIVDTHVPWLNRLNPANMITDGLYSIYYYSGTERYWNNIIHLLFFSGFLLLISVHRLRRQAYDYL